MAGKFSACLVGIGALICWVFFPFFSSDIPSALTYSYHSVTATYYSISACVFTSIGLSCVITGQIDYWDFVYSPVAGGVIVGSSAAFINNTAGAIILGIIAGIIHCLLRRW